MNRVILYKHADGTVGMIQSVSRTTSLEDFAANRFTADDEYKFVNKVDLPAIIFFDAWMYGPTITIDFDKAKDVAHHHRRIARTIEMRQYDDIVAKQIPGEVDDAEAQRALIRTKYATKQTEIDACTTLEELQAIIDEMRS